jgi:hypothetical protein
VSEWIWQRSDRFGSHSAGGNLGQDFTLGRHLALSQLSLEYHFFLLDSSGLAQSIGSGQIKESKIKGKQIVNTKT